jgi:four helix bundle protein
LSVISCQFSVSEGGVGVQDFHKLAVWQRAHQLTLKVYELTKTFPREEAYALTSQTRRAASSVPANIAEGCGRDGPVELARFLEIAFGSASELEYHLLLARDLGYIAAERHDDANREVEEVKMMLASLRTKVRGTRYTRIRLPTGRLRSDN